MYFNKDDLYKMFFEAVSDTLDVTNVEGDNEIEIRTAIAEIRGEAIQIQTMLDAKEGEHE